MQCLRDLHRFLNLVFTHVSGFWKSQRALWQLLDLGFGNDDLPDDLGV